MSCSAASCRMSSGDIDDGPVPPGRAPRAPRRARRAPREAPPSAVAACSKMSLPARIALVGWPSSAASCSDSHQNGEGPSSWAPVRKNVAFSPSARRTGSASVVCVGHSSSKVIASGMRCQRRRLRVAARMSSAATGRKRRRVQRSCRLEPSRRRRPAPTRGGGRRRARPRGGRAGRAPARVRTLCGVRSGRREHRAYQGPHRPAARRSSPDRSRR